MTAPVLLPSAILPPPPLPPPPSRTSYENDDASRRESSPTPRLSRNSHLDYPPASTLLPTRSGTSTTQRQTHLPPSSLNTDPPSDNRPPSSSHPSTTHRRRSSTTASHLPRLERHSRLEPSSPQSKHRKAPASWSSNGIETSTGPPPALSTRRSHAKDLARSDQAPSIDTLLIRKQLSQDHNSTVAYGQSRRSFARHRIAQPAPQIETAGGDLELDSDVQRPPHSQDADTCSFTNMSREEYEHDRDEVLEEDRDHTLRALEGRQIESSLKPDHPQYQQKEDTNGVESDLFLTLANTDSEPPAESRLEQMKSRLANKRQSLPADSFSSWRNPAPLLRETTDPDLRPRTQPATHSRRISQNISANYRSSIPSPSASRSAHPAEDTGKGRYLEGTSRTSFNPSISSHLDRTPSLSGGSERRPSLPVLTPNTPSRTYRQSNLSHAIPPDHPSHLTAERHANTQLRPTVPYPDDTESTVSTTAASTVWDELDSLKSRMRRLELTGRLPDSSDAAMTRAANDRPHTATTTVTTVSSSPRRGRMSPKASEASTAMGEANGPPLLQALQESKALLEPNVYGALEATAADALSLAAMVSSNHAGANLSSAASTIGMNTTNPVSDRQVRRKAESVCRSLTEFCVALAGSPNLGSPGAALHLQPNHGSPTISVAPRSPLLNDGMSDISPVQGYNTRRRGSAQSDALSIARSGSRALSRVEARRSSMMSFSNAPSPRTPQESSIPMSAASVGNSGAATPLTHMNLLKRTSTMLRSRRGVGVGDSSPLDDEAFSSRAPSRAATEIGIGHLRRGHGTGSPREYTSSHPLPHLPPSQPSQTPSHLAYQSPTPASLLRRPNHISTSIGTPSSNTPNTVATATSRRFLERSSPASSSVERNEGISLNGSKARNPSFGRIAVGLGRR